MPLGIAKLNTLASYAVSEGLYLNGAGGGETAYTLTNAEFNASAYTQNRLSYCGDDSSGQPVFFFAYDNGSGQFEGALIKINNNDTISETVVTLESSYSIYDGQGCVGYDTSSNLVFFANAIMPISGTPRAEAYSGSIDLDNLTFGTVYSENQWGGSASSAGITSVCYTGVPGKFIATYRNSGARIKMFLNWGSGVGSIGSENQISAIGDGVWQDFASPLSYDSTNGLIRVAGTNGNANQSWFTKFGNSSPYYYSSDTVNDAVSVGLAQTNILFLNDTTTLTMAAKDSAAKAAAHSITWGTNDSTAPSVSAGSEMTFTDSAYWNEGFAWGVDTATETVYVLYHNGSDWRITSVTHSGTSLTEGTPETITGVTTTNWNPCTSNAACVADSAQGLKFVALIDSSSGVNPHLYVRDLE